MKDKYFGKSSGFKSLSIYWLVLSKCFGRKKILCLFTEPDTLLVWSLFLS